MSGVDVVSSIDFIAGSVNTGIGCAFDIGGSLCKGVYVSRKKDGEREFVFISFPKCNLNEGLCHVQEKMDTHTGHVPEVIYTSGVAVRGEIKEKIETKFNAKVVNIDEAQGCVKGCEYLISHLPGPQALHFFTQGEAEDCMKLAEENKRFGRAFGMLRHDADVMKNWPPRKREDWDPARSVRDHLGNTHPYLTLSAGTGCFYVKVNEDGTYEHNGGTNRSGKFFQGLSRLLIGTDNYDEIVALAEEGDDSKLTNYMRELKSGSDEDSYASFPDDLPIFLFGKVVDEKKTLDSYKKADLARALVGMIATELATIFFYLCKMNGCHHVFLSGGLYKHPLLRLETTKAFISLIMTEGRDIGFHFLKHGIHSIALGALLHNE